MTKPKLSQRTREGNFYSQLIFFVFFKSYLIQNPKAPIYKRINNKQKNQNNYTKINNYSFTTSISGNTLALEFKSNKEFSNPPRCKRLA